jgi:TonB family protein
VTSVTVIFRGVALVLLFFATTAHAQRPAPPITPPVAIEGSQAQPLYPDSARRLDIQGTTTLRVQVLADGQVGEVAVEQSAGHPDLDQAAVDAARQWRFQPARRGTEPVPVWVRLAMTFTVRDVPNPDLARAVRAGVVTSLEGNAIARRVSLPDPVPLKVNDDVFLQDTIATGDAARIEMRLGGKMDVVMRERSALTITERPLRSSLDLEAGQLTIHLQGERMRPGEAIDVRTPNAVVTLRRAARVRVEAIPAKPGDAGTVTHIDVPDGAVSVAANVDFKNPLLYRGTPPSGIDLRAGQGITITGETAGAIRAAGGPSTK